MKFIIEGFDEEKIGEGWEPKPDGRELIIRKSKYPEKYVVLEINGEQITVDAFDLRKALLAF